MSVWSDIWSQVQVVADDLSGNEAGAATVPGGAPQELANATGAWSAVTAFLTALTDARTWASVGWVLLGLLLVSVGLMLWLKKSNYLPSVVPLPV